MGRVRKSSKDTVDTGRSNVPEDAVDPPSTQRRRFRRRSSLLLSSKGLKLKRVFSKGTTLMVDQRKLKSVVDFLPGHRGSDDVVVLGICPSSRTEPCRGGTFHRLDRLMRAAGISDWDFHNVIPDRVNSTSMLDVDTEKLASAVVGKKLVIALGGFVERVCKREGIECFRIPHPSSRNRQWNDPQTEEEVRIFLVFAYRNATDDGK